MVAAVAIAWREGYGMRKPNYTIISSVRTDMSAQAASVYWTPKV